VGLIIIARILQLHCCSRQIVTSSDSYANFWVSRCEITLYNSIIKTRLLRFHGFWLILLYIVAVSYVHSSFTDNVTDPLTSIFRKSIQKQKQKTTKITTNINMITQLDYFTNFQQKILSHPVIDLLCLVIRSTRHTEEVTLLS
jgi:hypothetical protein